MDFGTWGLLPGALLMDVGASASEILDWLKNGWGTVSTRVENARKVVEPVMWVAGSILALVPGTVAIYKWIYYRYSRLPYRFDDMLKKEEHRFKTARTSLLSSFQRPTPIKPFKAPIFVVPELAKAMRQLKWARWRNGRTLPSADTNLDAALSEITKQMEYWEKHQANYKRQQAAAYLLKGAIAAAKGQKAAAADKDGDVHHRTALTNFLQALAIDETDNEALEYAAHQHRILQETDDAKKLYSRLAELTDKPEPDSILIRMRALRYSGEMNERQYDATQVAQRLTDAKNQLDEALRIIPATARGELDHAFIHRYLASVEDKRGAVQLPLTHCNDAERIYLDLIRRKKDAAEAEAGLVDIRKLRKEIIARRSTAAAPDDQAPPPSNQLQ